MDYMSINGVVILPTAEQAMIDYRNGCRKIVIEAIGEANKKGFNTTRFAKLDDWLIEELKEFGFEVSIVDNDERLALRSPHKYKVVWRID